TIRPRPRRGPSRSWLRDGLHALAVVDAGRREVPGLEREPDAVEQPAVEPQVDPGHLRDLMEPALRRQDPADDAEDLVAHARGERRRGEAGDDVVHAIEAPVAEHARQ